MAARRTADGKRGDEAPSRKAQHIVYSRKRVEQAVTVALFRKQPVTRKQAQGLPSDICVMQLAEFLGCKDTPGLFRAAPDSFG